MKLVPPRERIRTLASDYQQMKTMIFGEAPEFGRMLETLQDLEDSINMTPR